MPGTNKEGSVFALFINLCEVPVVKTCLEASRTSLFFEQISLYDYIMSSTDSNWCVTVLLTMLYHFNLSRPRAHICVSDLVIVIMQDSKFHLSDCLRQVKMTVGQVEYLQDLSNGRLRISDFHISCIGFVYFRQVNGTFGQVISTIHLPDGQVHSIWNFENCYGFRQWLITCPRDHFGYSPSQWGKMLQCRLSLARHIHKSLFQSHSGLHIDRFVQDYSISSANAISQ